MEISEFGFKLVKHSEIKEVQLNQIIHLKNQHWNYSFESHLEWLERKIHNEDFHLLLIHDSNLVGYLNIVQVPVEVNGHLEIMNGIGNVCIDKKFLGKKFGFLLMNIANYYLNSSKLNSILLCNEKLSSFYQRCGWYQIYANSVKIEMKNYNNKLFSYNKGCFTQKDDILIYREF